MDNISLIYDKTEFPLIEIPEMNLFVHALPVTKFQFEKFISESKLSDFTDKWYENILKLNPRISCRKFTEKNYWKLFITGIYPKEAVKFAEYLGDDYRIPEVREWRKIYAYFKSLQFKPSHIKDKSNQEILSTTILKGLEKFSGDDLFSLTLMRKGIAEWVKEDEKYVGVGKPDANLYENAWNPLSDVIRQIDKNERLYYVGFRLVKDV